MRKILELQFSLWGSCNFKTYPILFVFHSYFEHYICRNPSLRECENETHTLEMGTWESSKTPKTLEFNCKGQNTSHWGVPYIIEKLSKFRCRKWVRMGHLDIFSTHYGKKKGRESNWQFDSRRQESTRP